MNASTGKPLLLIILVVLSMVAVECTALPKRESQVRQTPSETALPSTDFDHPPKAAFSRDDYFFKLEQLEHFYRVPGEFGYRLRGDDYGFEALSFIITETHPNGGPNLHVHDVEEAHVLLEGSAEYRIGDHTFNVEAPYVVKVPAGVPHTFLNVGTEPFKLVAVFASKRHNSTRLGPNPLVREAPRD